MAARYLSMERHAGGSLAIANHLAGFCGEVTLVAMFGDQDDGQAFATKTLSPEVQLKPLTARGRPTVSKRRYLEPNFYTKMFEIQRLGVDPLPESEEAALSNLISEESTSHDMVMACDFGHGMLTDHVISGLCESETFLAVNTQTNSANYGFNTVNKYPRADYVSVDESELFLSAGSPHGDPANLAQGFRQQLNARLFMVTRGKNGSILVGGEGMVTATPALSTGVVDRVGAGDAFYSVTAPAVYQGISPDIVGFLGNCVGALAVEVLGNREPVNPVELKKFITRLLK